MDLYVMISKSARILPLMIVIPKPHVEMTSMDHTLAIAIKGIMELVNGVMISMSVKMILATLTPHALIFKDHLNVLV